MDYSKKSSLLVINLDARWRYILGHQLFPLPAVRVPVASQGEYTTPALRKLPCCGLKTTMQFFRKSMKITELLIYAIPSLFMRSFRIALSPAKRDVVISVFYGQNNSQFRPTLQAI